MSKRRNIIMAAICLVALVVGACGLYLFESMTTTVYGVELANGCTKQPDGQIINGAVAGPSIDVRVANKDSAQFAAFALSRGICVDK